MFHHYMTKYKDEQEKLIVESWLQFDFFGYSKCFSILRLADGKIKKVKQKSNLDRR